MKILTTILAGLLVVGCGDKQPKENVDNETTSKGSKAKPVKELTLEEKVIGTYQISRGDGKTQEFTLRKDGVLEIIDAGHKEKDEKWKIDDEHLVWIKTSELAGNGVDGIERVEKMIFQVDSNGSITLMALEKNEVRTDIPKDNQPTFKKIK